MGESTVKEHAHEGMREAQITAKSQIRGVPESLRRQLLDTLSSHKAARRALLFGSRARGDAGPRSDVDLAVSAPSATRGEWLDIAFALEELDTLLKIDVLRLEEAPKALRDRIGSEGEVLYER